MKIQSGTVYIVGAPRRVGGVYDRPDCGSKRFTNLEVDDKRASWDTQNWQTSVSIAFTEERQGRLIVETHGGTRYTFVPD